MTGLTPLGPRRLSELIAGAERQLKQAASLDEEITIVLDLAFLHAARSDFYAELRRNRRRKQRRRQTCAGRRGLR